MCRLSAFFGAPICAADLVTRPSRSIITQSFDARERMTGDAGTPAYLNGDGFGLGWYSLNGTDPTPCVYRQARPAWNDPNLSSIAEKLYTRLLFAHVRAASAGLDVSETTCHPFRYGRYLFMHNGGLGGFALLRRHLLSTFNEVAFDFAVAHGSSDTALCFAVFLNLLEDPMKPQTPDKLRTYLEETVRIIERAQRETNVQDTSLLNFVLSDGESLIATRYVINLNNPSAAPASLYYASGNSYEPDGSAPGSYVMRHTDRRATLTIISSEPLTESRADWVSVPRNFCIVITKSMHVLLSAIRPEPIEKPDDVFSRILATLTTANTVDTIVTGQPQQKQEQQRRLDSKYQQLSERQQRFSDRSRDSPSTPYLSHSKTTSSHSGITLLSSSYPSPTVIRKPEQNSYTSNVSKQTVICPVGAAVTSSITVPDCTILCSTILDSFLCTGTNKGDVHIWDIDLSKNHSSLSTGCNAVQALLGCSASRALVVGTSVSTVLVFKMNQEGVFHRVLDVCCSGMGNILSLAMVNQRIFAGFSDAGLRCVIRSLEDDIDTNIVVEENSTSINTNPTTTNINDKSRNTILDDDKASERDESEENLCVTGDTATTRVVNVREIGYNFPKGNSTVVHKGFIFSLVPFANGRFLCSGCGDGILRVWDTQSERCVQMRNDHAGAILALAVYEVPRGTMLFSGSRDCSVKVWLWDGGRGFNCKRTLRKHKDEVVFLSVAGDKLVSGSADGAVFVWNAETLHLICQYRDKSLKAGAVSQPFNSLFTATDGDGIQVRDIISIGRKLRGKDNNLRGVGTVFSDEEAGYDSSAMGSNPILSSQLSTEKLHLGNGSDAAISGELNGVTSDVPDGGTNSAIVSEMGDDSDEAEVIVPGVENERVMAPPMTPGYASFDSEASKWRESDNEDFVNGDDEYGRTIDEDGDHDDGADTAKVRFVMEKLYPCAKREQHEENGSTALKLPPSPLTDNAISNNKLPHVFERRLIEDALRRFISIPTVANSTEHRESCWQGARYIGHFLEVMGASVKYVNTSSRNGYGDTRDDIPTKLSKREIRALALESETNPVVLARFAAADPNAETITFYGHYDVMPAMDLTEWETDPWKMKAIDGYFYGRGVTDNKGPIIAMAFAVKRLMEDSAHSGLGVNILLVLQGEGEAANVGLRECVTSHAHWFERTCLILTSNSTWLGENVPCLTYSFRGVVDLLVSVTGAARNLHSGVDGGVVFQPMNDLITVLGTLVDSSGVVCVPGFYDDVHALSDDERKRIHGIDFDIEEYRRATGVDRFTVENGVDVLEHRWRKPTLSIASVETSNVSGFYSVVPRCARAKISIRFVPDQNPRKLEAAVRAHLHHELRKRRSPNTLDVSCVNRGDCWLRDPTGEEFQIAARAVRNVWGVDPAYICEGGSMPLFSFLADTLNAPLIQVPLGQSSDGAHLPNERIRAVNLFRGKEVLQRIVAEYSQRAVVRSTFKTKFANNANVNGNMNASMENKE